MPNGDSSGSSSGSDSSSGSSSGGYELVSSPASGYVCAGIIQLGSNDAESGAPGLYLEGASDSTEGQIYWGPVTAGGLDSGYVDVSFDADLSGGDDALTLVIGDGEDPGAGGGMTSSGFVTKIQIVAKVSASNLRISWLGLTVQFNNSNEDSQSIALPEEVTPVATTWGGSGSSNLQVVEVTPLRGDCTKVSVSGEICLESSLSTLPAADALIAQILVFSE